MKATAWICEQKALSPCFPPQSLYYLHLDPLLLNLTSLTACAVFHFCPWRELHLLFTHALLVSPQSDMLRVFITFKPSTFLPFCPFAALPGAALGAELSPVAGAAPCRTQHPMWEGGGWPQPLLLAPTGPQILRHQSKSTLCSVRTSVSDGSHLNTARQLGPNPTLSN